MNQELLTGIKTFFLNADSSLNLEASQLQRLFLSGFEVYPLAESRLVPVADQVDCLANLFRELIVFVNIDSELSEGVSWETLIPRLTTRHGHRVRFGVLHHESDPDRRTRLEEYYLLEARVQGGCILIDQSRSPDMAKLRRILLANEANGRRKAIRIACKGRLNLTLGRRRFDARLLEISVSHFLCVFHGDDPGFGVSDRLTGIQFIVGGLVLTIDAVVLLKRISGGPEPEMVYVCGFGRPGTQDLGLGPFETGTLIQLIQTYCTVQIRDLIHAAYQARWKQNVLRGDQGQVRV